MAAVAGLAGLAVLAPATAMAVPALTELRALAESESLLQEAAPS
jgi:hypothetical protein